MYANILLTTTFKLTTYVPITFEDAPTNQYAVKNSDYKVRCRVRADPSPSIDWKKDHKTINASDHYVTTADGILIKNVSEYDEGVYTCRVRVISLGKVEERHIQLEVQEKPKILATQPPLEGVESGSLILECAATGKPEPEYEWVNERGQELSDLERFVVDKYKGTLRIDGLRREDAGTYRCTAKNTAGIDTMQTRVDIVTKPVIEEYKNVTAQVDGNTVLVCRASGEPAPDILFHKDSKSEPFTHGTQRDTRIFSEQRKEGSVTIARLKIDNLLRTDDGLYNCIASNTKIKTELLGHLTVEFPPSFANTPMKESWSWDGRPANMTCFAEAIPNATISWIFMSNPETLIQESLPDYQIYGTQSASSLQVYPRNRDRYGFYQCVATNKLGTASHRIQLKEARKPGTILQVISYEKTATSVAFKIVGPVDDGGLPILRFVAQYKEGNSYPWNEAKTVQWPVDLQIFVVEKLEPLHQYQFRFAAENAVGVGDYDQERFEIMPKRSSPEPPKILGEINHGFTYNPYQDKYELRWQVPQDNGEKIDHFEISHQIVKNSTGEWNTYGTKQLEQKNLGEPRHMIRNLSPGTYYRIEIRAHNVMGYSLPSSIYIRTALSPADLSKSSPAGTSASSSILLQSIPGFSMYLYMLLCSTSSIFFSTLLRNTWCTISSSNSLCL
ncbi:unnamed protein product [Allacma fusca]|uniref:Fasciclin-2 n=1 Tax=Allacma fusca TaxID=39272 RepID=A0A8J2K4M5_9HEXA|nr:unnamed protein product [Allacma fusca]